MMKVLYLLFLLGMLFFPVEKSSVISLKSYSYLALDIAALRVVRVEKIASNFFNDLEKENKNSSLQLKKISPKKDPQRVFAKNRAPKLVVRSKIAVIPHKKKIKLPSYPAPLEKEIEVTLPATTESLALENDSHSSEVTMRELPSVSKFELEGSIKISLSPITLDSSDLSSSQSDYLAIYKESSAELRQIERVATQPSRISHKEEKLTVISEEIRERSSATQKEEIAKVSDEAVQKVTEIMILDDDIAEEKISPQTTPSKMPNIAKTPPSLTEEDEAFKELLEEPELGEERVEQGTISESVAKAITRESSQSMPPVKLATKKLIKKMAPQPLSTFSPSKGMNQAMSESVKVVASEMMKKSQEEVTIQLAAYSVTKEQTQLTTQFMVAPSFAKSEAESDREGLVEIRASSFKGNYLSGSIVKEGHTPTAYTLSLPRRDAAVPLFQYEYLETLLTDKGLNFSNVVVVKIPQRVKSIEFSSEYEYKVELSEEMREVKVGESAYYLAFFNVTETMGELSLLLQDKSQKRLLISLKEVANYVDLGEVKESVSQVTLMIDHVGSEVSTPARFNLLDLKLLGRSDKIVQTALNQFELGGTQLSAEREYLSYTSGKSDLVVGFKNKERVTLPSIGLQSFVIDQFSYGSEESCYVQLNLSQPIEEFKVSLSQGESDGMVEWLAFDSDGVISEELSPMTKRLHIRGEGQGEINAELIYEGGQREYLRTFCRPQTYLVEEL